MTVRVMPAVAYRIPSIINGVVSVWVNGFGP